VQAVVTWYGIFDFTPLAKNTAPPPPVARYLGCDSNACSDDKIALASAIRHIDRNDPPFLLIHGALDKTVAVSQSEKFHAALQAGAVKSQLIVPAGRRPQLRRQHTGAHAQREPARAARHDRLLRRDSPSVALSDSTATFARGELRD
jgi:dipeptidyl aminopeptidase/acylaminoacyl peptidase